MQDRNGTCCQCKITEKATTHWILEVVNDRIGKQRARDKIKLLTLGRGAIGLRSCRNTAATNGVSVSASRRRFMQRSILSLGCRIDSKQSQHRNGRFDCRLSRVAGDLVRCSWGTGSGRHVELLQARQGKMMGYVTRENLGGRCAECIDRQV